MKFTLRFFLKIPSVVFWGLPFLFLLIFYFQPLFANFRITWQSASIDIFNATTWKIISKPLFFTIYQATLSTILTILLGFPVAYLLANYRFFGKSIIHLLTTIPFIMPTVVVAAGFNALFGPRGWLNLLLQSIFSLDQSPINLLNTLGAILLAHVFYNTTVFIRIVGGAWSQLDRKLEFAARTLGASKWRVWLSVTLPLLKPAIMSAIVLIFLFNFTSFAVILLLGGPKYATIEVEIFTQALHLLNLPMAGLLSAIQLFFTLVLTILYSRLISKKTVQLSPRDPEEITKVIKGWKQSILLFITFLILFFLYVLPLFSLILRSFLVSNSSVPSDFGGYRFTLLYFQELFLNRRDSLFYVPPVDAISNSLYFGLVTVGIALFLGFLAAKVISSKAWWGKILEPIMLLPLGTSAVTLGLGFILVFNKPPIDVRSFPLLVPIAHALVAMPFVVRIIQPALSSIPQNIKFSAMVLGASPWRTFTQVELPILFKAIISSALFAFTISLGEFGATTFISRPEQPTIPIAIYRYLSQPGGLNYGQAMAMSTILMVICALSIILIERLKLPNIKEF